VILPSAWRSAEHDTPSPIGSEAPWRGRRITRTSWQKYLPPNCAPTPNDCVSACTSCSIARSRKAWPSSEPCVGRSSRERQEASFTVFLVSSGEGDPITLRRGYGG